MACVSEITASEVDQELGQIEEDIRRLQNRANLLRRVRETPSVEQLTEFHARFVALHKNFCVALDTFGADTASLYEELAAALGHSGGTDFQDWVSARGDSGRLFRDAQRASEDFCVDTKTALYHEARKELELMFLDLKGFHPINGWFEFLLRNEGQMDGGINHPALPDT